MGGSSSTSGDTFDYERQILMDKNQYGVAIDSDSKKDDCTKPYRNAKLPNKLAKFVFEDEDKEGGYKTIWECFEKAASKYGGNKMLGSRTFSFDEKTGDYQKSGNHPKRGNFAWLTFSEVYKAALALGSGLRELGAKPKDAIGIYSVNRPEWVVSCLSFYSQNLKTVSLYATLGNDAVEYIVNHADIEIVVTESINLKSFIAICKKLPKLKVIIQIDYNPLFGNVLDKVSEENVQNFAKLNVKLLGLSEAIKLGETAANKPQPPGPDDLAYIMYTSGTTGAPKGAMLRHSNLMASVAAMPHIVKLNEKDSHISYLPLAHIFESVIQLCVWVSGGSIGFFCGDVSKLTEDCALLKPSILCGVPRVFTKIYQKVFAGVAEKNCIVNYVFNKAFNGQCALLRQGKSLDPSYDAKVFKGLREKLGFERVRLIVTGAAPCPPYVMEFLRIMTNGAMVSQGYGMTESAAALTFSMPSDLTIGHCGPPIACCELKLKDVPEMKYLHTDNPPRGEILVRGANIFAGYYKNEEATRECIDDDGFLMTGDVGRINPNGTLSIIDRKKNIFKLSQGEYIAAERIETIYGKSNIVAQVWIYGNSFRSFILAVVVPSAEVIRAYCHDKGWWPTPKEEVKVGNEQYIADFEKVFEGDHKAELKKLVFGKMNEENVHLKGFEKVKDIIIEARIDRMLAGFTEKNDCLTPSFKLKRPFLLKRYAKQLRELYSVNGEPPAQNEKWPGED